MIDSLTNRQSTVSFRSRWAGAAFLVEAMLLLVFTAASLVVLTQMFSAAAERAAQAEQLAQAVAVATNAAENFAADPHEGVYERAESGMVAVVESSPEKREGGVLYHAEISVYTFADIGVADSAKGASESGTVLASIAGGDLLYTLTTSVYESGVVRNG